MFIQQIFTTCLSQSSYYIESNGEAAIIDPLRDVEQYVNLAKERDTVIKFVFETHFHTDFVSGHIDLMRRTNCVIVFGPEAKPHYHAFIANHKELFKLGACVFKVIHTPGHTIESCCFLLMSEEGIPTHVFTGDTLFVGDVGRPDLLSGNLSKEVLAEKLYHSIQEELLCLPDDVVVYPGHGAGSACGKITSTENVSTIGEEKKSNLALQEPTKEAFIKYATTDQPFSPPYFFNVAKINMRGYDDLDDLLKRSLNPLDSSLFIEMMNSGAIILDCRNTDEFGDQHILGSINIGLDVEFDFWAGSLIPLNSKLLLVCPEGNETEVITRLARVGYENVLGFLTGSFKEWNFSKHKLSSIKTTSISEARRIYYPDNYVLIDVRNYPEVKKEKIFESINIPLYQILDLAEHFDKKSNYMVYCQGGYRSMIACSILQSMGFRNVINILGGIKLIKETNPELLEINN
jgi:glyoxylase-like metal-dependent hydrolase (beta-lactamase superfamily II)/rhodanese-related sulfurtransferase